MRHMAVKLLHDYKFSLLSILSASAIHLISTCYIHTSKIFIIQQHSCHFADMYIKFISLLMLSLTLLSHAAPAAIPGAKAEPGMSPSS